MMDDTPVMNIAVHGIGDGDADYYLSWQMPRILGVPPETVAGFYYEDLMQGSKLGMLGKVLLKALLAFYCPKLSGLFIDTPYSYLQDIFTFFLNADIRDMIEYRMSAILERHAKVRLFGHSLGSVVAYWYLIHHPEQARKVDLVTMGSPLGSPIVEGAVRFWLGRISTVPLVRPKVKSWHNIASELDPLSGLVDYGCHLSDQIDLSFRNKTFHREVDEYLFAYENASWDARGPRSVA